MDLVRTSVCLRRPLKGEFAGDQRGDQFENQFSRVFSAGINWLLCPKAQYKAVVEGKVLFFVASKFQRLTSHSQALPNTVMCDTSSLSPSLSPAGMLRISCHRVESNVKLCWVFMLGSPQDPKCHQTFFLPLGADSDQDHLFPLCSATSGND